MKKKIIILVPIIIAIVGLFFMQSRYPALDEKASGAAIKDIMPRQESVVELKSEHYYNREH